MLYLCRLISNSQAINSLTLIALMIIIIARITGHANKNHLCDLSTYLVGRLDESSRLREYLRCLIALDFTSYGRDIQLWGGQMRKAPRSQFRFTPKSAPIGSRFQFQFQFQPQSQYWNTSCQKLIAQPHLIVCVNSLSLVIHPILGVSKQLQIIQPPWPSISLLLGRKVRSFPFDPIKGDALEKYS